MHAMPDLATDRPIDLRRHRLAIAAAFGVQGLVFISLTTRLPRIQDRWDLGELALSGVLLMMVLLAGAGSLVAERLAPRLDSAVVLRAGLLVVAVSVAVLILAPTKGVFVLGLAAYGVGLGLVDATGNMQAVALEHRMGRVILPSCHGAWTLGGVIGAVLTLATTGVPWSAIALVALLPLAAAAAPYLPRDHGESAVATDTDVPWRPIVMVGLALVVEAEPALDQAAAARSPDRPTGRCGVEAEIEATQQGRRAGPELRRCQVHPPAVLEGRQVGLGKIPVVVTALFCSAYPGLAF